MENLSDFFENRIICLIRDDVLDYFEDGIKYITSYRIKTKTENIVHNKIYTNVEVPISENAKQLKTKRPNHYKRN